MTISPTVRISRRGHRDTGASAHSLVEMPCLNPDLAVEDTGR